MKILLPVDGSKPSHETVDWVLQVFNPKNTQIDLLTVVPHNMPELPIEAFEIEDAVDHLSHYEHQVSEKGFKVNRAEYVLGEPVRSICEYADEEHVDQVIIGSHGRSGLLKMLMGSVSAGVLEHCHKPVFIFKKPQC